MSESAFEVIKKAEEEAAKLRSDASEYLREKKDEGAELLASLEREHAKKISEKRVSLEKKEKEIKAEVLKRSEEEWNAKKASLDKAFAENCDIYVERLIDKGVGIFGDSENK